MKTATSANTAANTNSHPTSVGAWLFSHDLVACPVGTPRHELFVDGAQVTIKSVDADPWGGTVTSSDGRTWSLPDDPCAHGSWGCDPLTANTYANTYATYPIAGGPCTQKNRHIQADTWREALQIAAERDARRLHRNRGAVGPVRVAEEGRGWVRVEAFIGRRVDMHLEGRSYIYDVSY